MHQLIACNDKELQTNWKKLTLVVSVSKHCSLRNLSSENFQLSTRNLLAPSAGHKQLCFGEARGFNKLVVKHLAKQIGFHHYFSKQIQFNLQIPTHDQHPAGVLSVYIIMC